MNDTLITIKNLFFKFPQQEQWFFQNLNFTIKNNTKVVIFGKNGSGKSTLGKLLVGLYLPTSGQVIENNNQAQNQFFSSMIFQNPDHQIIGSTVIEELALTREIPLPGGKVFWG